MQIINTNHYRISYLGIDYLMIWQKANYILYQAKTDSEDKYILQANSAVNVKRMKFATAVEVISYITSEESSERLIDIDSLRNILDKRKDMGRKSKVIRLKKSRNSYKING